MILQISWLFDYIPNWIPTLLVFSGVTISSIGLFLSLRSREREDRLPLLACFLFMLGALVGIYDFYVTYPGILAIFLISFARYIEGIAVLRLYQKVEYMFREGELPSEYSVSMPKKSLLWLSATFLIILSISFYSFLVLAGKIDVSFGYSVAILWAIITVFYTIVGLSIKFGAIDAQISSFFTYGLILVIAGAEIYNFSNIRGDLISWIAGSIAYSLGYWFNIYRLLNGSVISASN